MKDDWTFLKQVSITVFLCPPLLRVKFEADPSPSRGGRCYDGPGIRGEATSEAFSLRGTSGPLTLMVRPHNILDRFNEIGKLH